MPKGNSSSAGKAKKAGEKAALAFYGLTSAVLAWVLLDRLGFRGLAPLLRQHDELIFGVALAGALIGMTRFRRLLHIAAAGVVILWFVVAFSPLAGRWARSMKVEAAPVPADAVVVLASQVQEDGDFTDQSLARLTRGLELMHAESAPRLVLSEVPRPAGSYRAAAEQLMNRLGIRCPVEVIGTVRHTRDEAVLTARRARERGWKRILLVTSPTHSRRAAAAFRKAGLEVVSTPCREVRYNLERPGGAGERERAFAEALREWLGLQIYRLRGWA